MPLVCGTHGPQFDGSGTPAERVKAAMASNVTTRMLVLPVENGRAFLIKKQLGKPEIPSKRSDQPALLQRSFDEAREQGMRLERPALQLGMELDADEPRMVGTFDDLGQLVVGRHAGEDQPRSLQRVAIMDVDLVAVAMPLADPVLAVDRTHHAVAVELGLVGAEAHRAAKVAVDGALLQPFFAHPFGDEADDRLGRFAELR